MPKGLMWTASCGLALLLIGLNVSFAQVAGILDVEVQLLDRAQDGLDNPGAVEAEAAKLVIAKLRGPGRGNYFRWNLRPITTSDNRFDGDREISVPRLLVRVEGRLNEWTAQWSLFVPAGEHPFEADTSDLKLWLSGLLVRDQDTEPRPDYPKVASWVADKFESTFLTGQSSNDKRPKLHFALCEDAPIALGIVLEHNQVPQQPQELKGMVLLPFEEFKMLAMSTFKFACRDKNGQLVDLVSDATTGEANAEPFAEQPAKAISVVHRLIGKPNSRRDIDFGDYPTIHQLAFAGDQPVIVKVMLNDFVEYNPSLYMSAQ